jgi:hypothetical protein
MNTYMKGFDEKRFALGRFKILMMPDARMVLEKKKEEAATARNQSAEYIKKSFNIYFSGVAAK